MGRILNYYPNYSTRRLNFWEVETHYCDYAIACSTYIDAKSRQLFPWHYFSIYLIRSTDITITFFQYRIIIDRNLLSKNKYIDYRYYREECSYLIT